MARTLFTDVKIFDGTGAAPFAGEVLVQGNRIEEVAKGKARIARDGAEVIEGGGATLMPGMTEGHGHISYTDLADLREIRDLPPEDHMLKTLCNAQLLLDSGFTSIHSGGSAKPRLEVALRDAIEAGEVRGPRLKAASQPIISTGNLGDSRRTHLGDQAVFYVADGADEVRRGCRLMLREGVDSIKLNISGENFVNVGSEALAYSDGELAAAAEIAHENGIELMCHARAHKSVKMALKHGFRSIFHADFADEEALDMLEAKKDEVFLAPAVGFIYVMTHEYAEWGVTREFVEKAQLPRILEHSCRTYAEVRKRGIRAVPGGDYGINCCPQGRNARDLELFVKLYGFTPAEALKAATQWGGEMMGMGDELGLIKPGYLADLLCIDGDPTKDIAIMQDRDRILAIMKDGAFHKTPPPPAREAQAA